MAAIPHHLTSFDDIRRLLSLLVYLQVEL